MKSPSSLRAMPIQTKTKPPEPSQGPPARVAADRSPSLLHVGIGGAVEIGIGVRARIGGAVERVRLDENSPGRAVGCTALGVGGFATGHLRGGGERSRLASVASSGEVSISRSKTRRESSVSSVNSRSVGRSFSDLSPKNSRKSAWSRRGSGGPGSSFLPRMRTRSRLSSSSSAGPESTPRTSSTSGRVIGCRYAMIARSRSARASCAPASWRQIANERRVRRARAEESAPGHLLEVNAARE